MSGATTRTVELWLLQAGHAPSEKEAQTLEGGSKEDAWRLPPQAIYRRLIRTCGGSGALEEPLRGACGISTTRMNTTNSRSSPGTI